MMGAAPRQHVDSLLMGIREDGSAVGIVDFKRLGVWVRFRATIVERETAHDQLAVVESLEATDDDGVVVPLGKSEHASVVVMFQQAYYRWRRRESRG